MAKYNTRSSIFVNSYERKEVNGKEYLVVPAVPVQEQVMNNYLVPADELEMAEIWNGTSICIRHPKKNNGSVNVPEPDVAVIGKFFNGSWDGDGNRITGEYWIDISEAMQYVEGQYVVNAIYANQVLETSTGYWAAVDNTSGEFNGRNYDIIHRNLKPDHIAILVDEVGACSVADGCGVNRNSLLYELYTNVDALNGGPGSGFWGHLGRPGQVGGAAPSGKSVGKKKPIQKKLKKGVTAYYVAGKAEANKKKNGFKTTTSLMSKARAQALFERMTNSGSEPAILEVNLKAGTEYERLTASSITVKNIPGANIKLITFETLKKRVVEKFTNAADCDCKDAKDIVNNEESISQKIEAIRKAFYSQEAETPYNFYIMDYFSDYLIVEGNNQLWKCTYTANDGEYKFQDMDDWTKMQPNPEKYVEANQGTVAVTNVLGDLPPKAKKIWEKVYQEWLSEHPKDKAGASKRAWGAVKQAGWKKGKSGWVKSNSIVKGVETKNVRTIRTGSNTNWTVQNNRKEKPMTIKQRVGDMLAALRNNGVAINTDDAELDEDVVLELEELEGDDEEPEVEQPTRNTRQAPASPFTQKQVAALNKLAGMDFDKLLKLAEQLPAVMEIAQNAESERASKKSTLIAGIKTNSAQPFSDEELNGFSLPVLTKLHAQFNVDYSGLAGGYQFSTNVAATDLDEDVLTIPPVLLAAPEEAAK